MRPTSGVAAARASVKRTSDLASLVEHELAMPTRPADVAGENRLTCCAHAALRVRIMFTRKRAPSCHAASATTVSETSLALWFRLFFVSTTGGSATIAFFTCLPHRKCSRHRDQPLSLLSCWSPFSYLGTARTRALQEAPKSYPPRSINQPVPKFPCTSHLFDAFSAITPQSRLHLRTGRESN